MRFLNVNNKIKFSEVKFDSVIILCGGKGRRMRNLSIYPKPLVKISKKPILKYLIDYFLKNDLKNIILATGHKSKKVENFVNTNYKKDIKCINSGNVDILERLKKFQIIFMMTLSYVTEIL